MDDQNNPANPNQPNNPPSSIPPTQTANSTPNYPDYPLTPPSTQPTNTPLVNSQPEPASIDQPPAWSPPANNAFPVSNTPPNEQINDYSQPAPPASVTPNISTSQAAPTPDFSTSQVPHWATPPSTTPDQTIPPTPPSAPAEPTSYPTFAPSTPVTEPPITFPPINNASTNSNPSTINFNNLPPATTTDPSTPVTPPPPSTPPPAEPAPTDLSHLASLAPDPSTSTDIPVNTSSSEGTPFTPSQFIPPVQVNTTTSHNEDQDHKINTILIIVLPIIALAVLFGSIYYFFFAGSPADTAPASIPAVSQQAPLTQPKK